ncbi:MAG TPA: VacJ family lipoprotein [Thermodesulfovibrionales bacterium]|nr:VacJ family lipoprotein [Thermodesulfovibrionales bacterium]
MNRFLKVVVLLSVFLIPAFARAETPAAAPQEQGMVSEKEAVQQETPSSEPAEGAAAAPDVSQGATETPQEPAAEEGAKGEAAAEAEPPEEEVSAGAVIADPFEPLNRIAFGFNDKLYFWFMKPASKVYNRLVPEAVRVAVRNFFYNIATPVRFVNCLLQAKFKAAGNELFRLGVNSTMGFGGFFDLAKTGYNVGSSEEDLGLTLGHYGIGNGFYMVLPFLGPSSLRDTVGIAGDAFLNPEHYITPIGDAIAVAGYDYFNRNSLRIGEYEDLKEAAVEPYTAFRDAYVQYRKDKLRQ